MNKKEQSFTVEDIKNFLGEKHYLWDYVVYGNDVLMKTISNKDLKKENLFVVPVTCIHGNIPLPLFISSSEFYVLETEVIKDRNNLEIELDWSKAWNKFLKTKHQNNKR